MRAKAGSFLAALWGVTGALAGPLSPVPVPAAAQGVVVGNPLPLDAPAFYVPFPPAGHGNGPFVLSWLAADDALKARAFDASGQPRTPVLDLAMSATFAATAMDGEGGFLIAWYIGGSTGRVEARRFHSDGSPATGTLLVSDIAAYQALGVALRADGSFVVTWAVADTMSERLVVRLFDATGDPQGPEIPVSGFLGFENVSVDLDATGGFVLAYTRRPFFEAWVRLFDRHGHSRSEEIRVSPVAESFRTYYVTGARFLPDGSFAVSFLESDFLTQPTPGRTAYLVTLDSAGSRKPVGSATLVPAGSFVTALWLADDAAGNLATFGEYHTGPADPLAGRFRIANAGKAEVGVATITKPQLTRGIVSRGTDEEAEGLVALGTGAFNVIWQLGQPFYKAYIQSFLLPPEPGASTSFFTVPPCRLVDTRVTAAPLSFGEDRVLVAAGKCAIPTGARSVAINAVAVAPTAAGNLRFYRPDRLAPGTAALSYQAGATRGSFVVLGLDERGRFVARATQSSGSVHLVIDVTGYFE